MSKKGVLEFDLPADTGAFKLASHAEDIASFVHEWHNFLRGKSKYAPDTEHPTWGGVYEEWLGFIRESSLPDDLL